MLAVAYGLDVHVHSDIRCFMYVYASPPRDAQKTMTARNRNAKAPGLVLACICQHIG